MARGVRSPLIGRAPELAQLMEAVERTKRGDGGVCVLTGEAGLGKSRLLSEAADHARSSGFTVFTCGADPLTMASPFSVIAEAIEVGARGSDPAYRALTSLLAETPTGDGITWGLQYRLIEAFADFLETAALRAPILLALDDAHWADRATLLVIRAAQARLQSLSACILLAYRPSAASQDLTVLIERLIRLGAAHLSLDSLSAEEVVRFLSSSFGARPGPRLLDLGMGTGGNPFLLTELVSEVKSLVEPGPGPGQVEVPDVTLPRGLRVALERRVESLSEEGRSLLRVASLLGNGFEATELMATLGRPPVECLSALAELLKAGILEEQDASLYFRHDLIREQIHETIPAGLRATLHCDIARSLVRVNSAAFRIAHHYALAGPTAADEATEWLSRAARDATYRDPQTAIGLLRHALEPLSDVDRRRPQIEADLAVLLAYSGRPDEAESLTRRLLASPEGARYEESLRSALVQALFAGGRWSEVASEVERARDVGQVSERTLGRLLAESALARIWLGDVDGAEADAKEAIAIGEATGDAVTTCFALGHLSTVAGRKTMVAEGVALARRALEIAEGLPEADRRHPHIALGAALIDADRPEEAKAAFRAGQRVGERAGTVWDLPLYHAFLALAMFELGEWDDAIAECEAGLSLSDETGVDLARVQVFGLLASIALRRGEEAKARSCIASADLIIEQSGPQWGMAGVSAARAEMAGDEGKADIARSRLREIWQQGTVLALQGPSVLRLAKRFNDRHLVSMFRRRLDESHNLPDAQHVGAAVLVCRGLLQNDAALLLWASDLYASNGRQPAEAAARADAGAELAAAGRAAEAKTQFDRALSIYERLGATRDVRRTAALMRSLGIRRGVRLPHRRATSGWASLTETELKVARLAAEGRTNPEIGTRLFVSRRTVQTHLSHVFAKLQISSRVELAVMVSHHRS